MTTLWDKIDVGLPEFRYQKYLSLDGKGSTAWASHSHTPCAVRKWDTSFDTLIAGASTHSISSQNVVPNTMNLEEQLRIGTPQTVIGREEDVTSNALAVLNFFGGHTQLGFASRTTNIFSIPDIVSTKVVEESHESFEDRTQPPIEGTQAKLKQEAKEAWLAAYLFPFETKPYWKFQFLLGGDSTDVIIREWGMPRNYSSQDIANERPLLQSWSHKKVKIFHLIRQVYGQMVASHRRYGVIHLWEVWWFCRRTDEGVLLISRPFTRQETSPSIFQVILALSLQMDHDMEELAVHDTKSLSQPPRMSRRRSQRGEEDKDGYSKPAAQPKRRTRNRVATTQRTTRGKTRGV